MKNIKRKLKHRLREFFYRKEYDVCFDLATGEYSIRAAYRCKCPDIKDKFGWRHYAKTLPVKSMSIPYKDFRKLIRDADKFVVEKHGGREAK